MLVDFAFRGIVTAVTRNDFSEVYVGDAGLWRPGQNCYDAAHQGHGNSTDGLRVNLVLIYPPTARVLMTYPLYQYL
jgi:hypothetical protein